MVSELIYGVDGSKRCVWCGSTSISPTRVQRQDGTHYRPAASTQYRPSQQLPPAQSSGSDEGILSTLSSGFNSLVNNIFG
ncbi:AGAP000756-PA-like protein [Anopheles sinensis]|uniref:AGAP000756-PA-like protein n=1 Tax=Anopheles sinensis TaxID=74873 RepID=A0A084VQJ0_ANOSI|nr:AGAP000756-PA-like protein [Anopheles sinensis]